MTDLTDKARVAELEAKHQAAMLDAIHQITTLAREAGEAKGRLEGSELAGVVDGWREKCARLEAENKRLQRRIEDAEAAEAAARAVAIKSSHYD